MSANETQVGGDHYKSATGVQHWDFVCINNIDYLRAQVLKYLQRWKKKNGLQDLQKAAHFYEKLLEVPRQPMERHTWSVPFHDYIRDNEVGAEEASIMDDVLSNGTVDLRVGLEALRKLITAQPRPKEQS